MKITFLKHITIILGIIVGGASLVYANTFPFPKSEFFNKGSWAGLYNWEAEFKPFYDIAFKMLGANLNPKLFDGDIALKNLSAKMDRVHLFFTNRGFCFLWKSRRNY